MSDWHFSNSDMVMQGPLPESEIIEKIKNGGITRETLVWRAGMDEWARALKTELGVNFQNIPPALPKPRVPISQSTTIQAGSSAQTPSKGTAPKAIVGKRGGRSSVNSIVPQPDPSLEKSDNFEAEDYSARPIEPDQAFKECWTKYATFTGRASRSEFWYWMFQSSIINFIAGVVSTSASHGSFWAYMLLVSVLALIIPTLAVTIRRLHDVGLSGWFLWITLIPAIGIVTLIIFLSVKGKKTMNAYN
jgi:uncharacterized membrane protein YhaH (DUF805 family)